MSTFYDHYYLPRVGPAFCNIFWEPGVTWQQIFGIYVPRYLLVLRKRLPSDFPIQRVNKALLKLVRLTHDVFLHRKVIGKYQMKFRTCSEKLVDLMQSGCRT